MIMRGGIFDDKILSAKPEKLALVEGGLEVRVFSFLDFLRFHDNVVITTF